MCSINRSSGEHVRSSHKTTNELHVPKAGEEIGEFVIQKENIGRRIPQVKMIQKTAAMKKMLKPHGLAGAILGVNEGGSYIPVVWRTSDLTQTNNAWPKLNLSYS